MAWPSEWTTGEDITQTRLRAWTDAIKTWGGNVSGGGYDLNNVGKIGIGAVSPACALHIGAQPDASNRQILVQPAIGNKDSEIWLAPSGTAVHAAFRMYYSADITTNYVRMFMGSNENVAGTFEIGVTKGGSASLLPMIFTMGGTEKLRITETGYIKPTLPGPYANDAAAAAGGVPVGGLYYASGDPRHVYQRGA